MTSGWHVFTLLHVDSPALLVHKPGYVCDLCIVIKQMICFVDIKKALFLLKVKESEGEKNDL